MPHKFDPHHMKKLDDRKKILPPKELLLELGLGPGHVMLDVGAGAGYFSIPASEIVGASGKVIAVDTSEEMIRELQSRMGAAGIGRIEVILSHEYDLMVGGNISDFTLLCTVLHEIEDKALFLKEIQKAMKPGSILAVIEWIKKPMEMGPPLHDRLYMAETAGLLKELNFRDIHSKDYNGYFYYITAIR